MAQFFKEVARQRGNDALYEENYDKIFGKKAEIVVNQETSQEAVTTEDAEKEEKEKLIFELRQVSYLLHLKSEQLVDTSLSKDSIKELLTGYKVLSANYSKFNL